MIVPLRFHSILRLDYLQLPSCATVTVKYTKKLLLKTLSHAILWYHNISFGTALYHASKEFHSYTVLRYSTRNGFRTILRCRTRQSVPIAVLSVLHGCCYVQSPVCGFECMLLYAKSCSWAQPVTATDVFRTVLRVKQRRYGFRGRVLSFPGAEGSPRRGVPFSCEFGLGLAGEPRADEMSK